MKNFYACIISVLMLCSFSVIAQERTITGTVTERATGLTLPGVTIIEKGTSNGTITNAKGEYSIGVSDSATALVFSFIGMNKEEHRITTANNIHIQMDAAATNLDEVVVIGYGAVKKSDLTGSVSSIDMEKLIEIPANSFDKKLQGRVSGVQVTQLSGQPGGATSIRIRGGNSIMAGNEPLYVVDGVLMEGQQNFSWIGSPAENGLSSINPNDIESMEILKDASATAIYGARGANGVVIITTKKGKKGQGNITFNAYVGLQQKSSNIDVMNASQFARLFDEAGINVDSNYTPLYPNPDSLGEGTDWQKEIYRDAPIQNYSLNFSGGDDKSTYSIGGDYFSQDGIIQGSDFKRYSMRANFDRQVVEKVRVGVNMYPYPHRGKYGIYRYPGWFFPGSGEYRTHFQPDPSGL